jgi:hypothetical protein
MMMPGEFDLATKCFGENLQLSADGRAEPEKFNLYTGLASLSEGLKKLERDINVIQQILSSLSR